MNWYTRIGVINKDIRFDRINGKHVHSIFHGSTNADICAKRYERICDSVSVSVKDDGLYHVVGRVSEDVQDAECSCTNGQKWSDVDRAFVRCDKCQGKGVLYALDK